MPGPEVLGPSGDKDGAGVAGVLPCEWSLWGSTTCQANPSSSAEARGPWPGNAWALGLDLHTRRLATALSPWQADTGGRSVKGEQVDWGPVAWGGLPTTGLALTSLYPSHFLCHYLATGAPKEPLLLFKLFPDPSPTDSSSSGEEAVGESLGKHSWSPGWEVPRCLFLCFKSVKIKNAVYMEKRPAQQGRQP